MDKRIAQNALNFILSDRFSFNGGDFLPLVEIVCELQAVVNGQTENQPVGDSQTEA